MIKSTKSYILLFLIFILSSSAYSSPIGVCRIDINKANPQETLQAINCLKKEYLISNKIANGILNYTIKFEKRVNVLENQHGYCKFIEQKHRSQGGYLTPVLQKDYDICQVDIPRHIRALLPIANRVKKLIADSKALKEHHVYLMGRLNLLKMHYNMR